MTEVQKIAETFAMEYLTGHYRPLRDDERKSFDQLTVVLLAFAAQLQKPAESGGAVPGAPRWQKIDSAPKDGTVVIGYDPGRDDDDGLPHGVDFMRWWDGAWIDPLTHSLQPSHWMPLPLPPSPSQK